MYTNVLRSGRLAVFAHDFVGVSADVHFCTGREGEFVVIHLPKIAVAKSGPFCGLPVGLLSYADAGVSLPFSPNDTLSQVRNARTRRLRVVDGRVVSSVLACGNICGPSRPFATVSAPVCSFFVSETQKGDCGSWFYDEHGLLSTVLGYQNLLRGDDMYARLPADVEVTVALSTRALSQLGNGFADVSNLNVHVKDVVMARGRRFPAGLAITPVAGPNRPDRARRARRGGPVIPQPQPVRRTVRVPRSLGVRPQSGVPMGRLSGSIDTSVANAYMNMLMNPHERRNGVRYPDDSLLPTALTHLTEGLVYKATGADFITAIRWKCVQNIPGNEISPIQITTGGVVQNCYLEPIFPVQPVPVAGTSSTGFYSRWDTYGANQESWSSLSNTDRTLAAGIRIKPAGLPPSSFAYSGNLYWLQVQMEEAQSTFDSITQQGEYFARQMVNAGKGFTVTADELNKCKDGINLTILPAGPNGYVFSDTNTQASAIAGAFPASQISSAWPGTFPSTLASNGLVIVCAFGLDPGEKFFIEYSHHIEYTPRATASGIIATKVQVPSASQRDKISGFIAGVANKLFGSKTLTQVLGEVGRFGQQTYDAYRTIRGMVDTLNGGHLPSMPNFRRGGLGIRDAPVYMLEDAAEVAEAVIM